ncbi:hypothetical protein [Streptomyces rubradiris]|uniref:Lipoprotein n=1 Tax=Streptomyces rubradiris TaxID=285531 RepID=A0ABQ3RIR4_STRRR|nr:hypothetical protein [Streptomyces rubradiris]GHH07350.1 hypothetical protein GCM10018792_27770 [Streptomyces rubradiris]GHI55746.1 hypothetical protein Srubr_55920 [Streptomyces rubradiris]
MKIKLTAFAVALPLALTTLTGCDMTENESDDVTSAGTSTSSDAADAVEGISSGIYDLIGVKGKASDSRSGVEECEGKDRDTYFKIFHPWSFYPASASDLDDAMRNLRERLPEHGWKIVQYGPDTSKNRNIVLIADNDERKAGVHIAQMAKNDPPKLSVDVVSGCYKVPDGQKVEHF